MMFAETWGLGESISLMVFINLYNLKSYFGWMYLLKNKSMYRNSVQIDQQLQMLAIGALGEQDCSLH